MEYLLSSCVLKILFTFWLVQVSRLYFCFSPWIVFSFTCVQNFVRFYVEVHFSDSWTEQWWRNFLFFQHGKSRWMPILYNQILTKFSILRWGYSIKGAIRKQIPFSSSSKILSRNQTGFLSKWCLHEFTYSSPKNSFLCLRFSSHVTQLSSS